MEMDEARAQVAKETAAGAALPAAEQRRQQHYALIVIGELSAEHQLWKVKERINQGEFSSGFSSCTEGSFWLGRRLIVSPAGPQDCRVVPPQLLKGNTTDFSGILYN